MKLIWDKMLKPCGTRPESWWRSPFLMELMVKVMTIAVGGGGCITRVPCIVFEWNSKIALFPSPRPPKFFSRLLTWPQGFLLSKKNIPPTLEQQAMGPVSQSACSSLFKLFVSSFEAASFSPPPFSPPVIHQPITVASHRARTHTYTHLPCVSERGHREGSS